MEYISFGKQFSVLTKTYVGRVTKRLEETPISKYFVPFYIISQNNGTINQQQLANELHNDKVSMVRIIDCLSAKGMISREVNPEDRREHLLKITAKGEQWVSQIKKAILDTNDEFLSVLPEQEREQFLINLKKMSESVLTLPQNESDDY